MSLRLMTCGECHSDVDWRKFVSYDGDIIDNSATVQCCVQCVIRYDTCVCVCVCVLRKNLCQKQLSAYASARLLQVRSSDVWQQLFCFKIVQRAVCCTTKTGINN